jgi:ABC-type lipoprotein export system ATPase subunit
MDNEFEKWSHRWSLREQANHQRIAAAADQTHNHVIIWADERIEALEKALKDYQYVAKWLEGEKR